MSAAQRIELANALRPVAAFLAVIAISLLDYISGPDLSFSLFYFAALAWQAWTGAGLRESLASALIVSIVWFLADWYSIEARPVAVLWWNATTRLAVLVALAVIVCRLRSALSNERALARTDFLTGALNARAFAEQAHREISRGRRYGHPLTAAYLDLDDFKRINDEFGHSYGDKVLRTVVGALRAHLRESDTLARMGGDEFIVLLPETGAAHAEEVLDKLRSVVSEAMADRGLGVTFSIGAVVFDPPPTEVDALISSADKVMYGAKREGKNRILIEREATVTTADVSTRH